jgi:hypothetical protein
MKLGGTSPWTIRRTGADNEPCLIIGALPQILLNGTIGDLLHLCRCESNKAPVDRVLGRW